MKLDYTQTQSLTHFESLFRLLGDDFRPMSPVADRPHLPLKIDTSDQEADFHSVFSHLARISDKSESPPPCSPPRLLPVQKVIQKNGSRGCRRSGQANLTASKPVFPDWTLPKNCIRKVPSSLHLYSSGNPNHLLYNFKCCFDRTKITVVFQDYLCSLKLISVRGRAKLPAEKIFFDLVISSANNVRFISLIPNQYKKLDKQS